MEQELNQLVQAILIASDPSSGALHQQALEYLSSFQQNSANTWRPALSLFVETGSDGARKHPPQARFFALRVLDDFLDNRCAANFPRPRDVSLTRSMNPFLIRFEPLDQDSFQTLRQSLISYIQSEYLYGTAEANAACECPPPMDPVMVSLTFP